MHLLAGDGMHKPQRHGVQCLPRTSVEAIVYKLFVFGEVGSFQDFVPTIAFVVEKYVNNWKSISLQIWQTVDIIFNQHLQCLMMIKESKKVLH